VVLLLAQDSILVAVDTLVEEGSLVAAHIPVVEEGNLEEEDSLVKVGIPVGEGNLEEEGSLAMMDILVRESNPVVGILQVAFEAQPCRIVVALLHQDLSHVLPPIVVQVMVFLLVAVQMEYLLQVVRLAVPGCPYLDPPTSYLHIIQPYYNISYTCCEND
jgi:hypothetical protein